MMVRFQGRTAIKASAIRIEIHSIQVPFAISLRHHRSRRKVRLSYRGLAGANEKLIIESIIIPRAPQDRTSARQRAFTMTTEECRAATITTWNAE